MKNLPGVGSAKARPERTGMRQIRAEERMLKVVDGLVSDCTKVLLGCVEVTWFWELLLLILLRIE